LLSRSSTDGRQHSAQDSQYHRQRQQRIDTDCDCEEDNLKYRNHEHTWKAGSPAPQCATASPSFTFVFRIDPRANIFRAVDDSNTCCLEARQKLHGFPTNESDFFKIEKHPTLFLPLKQLLELFDMLTVQVSAKGEDNRRGSP